MQNYKSLFFLTQITVPSLSTAEGSMRRFTISRALHAHHAVEAPRGGMQGPI